MISCIRQKRGKADIIYIRKRITVYGISGVSFFQQNTYLFQWDQFFLPRIILVYTGIITIFRNQGSLVIEILGSGIRENG